VFLLRLEPGAQLPARASAGGEETFVIEGTLELVVPHATPMDAWSWRRSADATQPAMRAPLGALVWIKRGHL
jgi:hypothetical protein